MNLDLTTHWFRPWAKLWGPPSPYLSAVALAKADRLRINFWGLLIADLEYGLRLAGPVIQSAATISRRTAIRIHPLMNPISG
jgi:hypothetical protein